MRNRSEQMASEEPPGGTTEKTSDHPPLAGPVAGCGSRGALLIPEEAAPRFRDNAAPL
jgi:hypothetical protein